MDAAPANSSQEFGIVTQSAFQANVARLVVDPDFRDQIRANGCQSLEGELTSLEQERVMSIVSERGLDATRTLHKSFRLTKLYKMLPLTRRLLGPARLVPLIGSFWQLSPPVSHYFLEESIAFCDFLLDRIKSGLVDEYLEEVVSYERAKLILKHPMPGTDDYQNVVIQLRHDPSILFAQLAQGKVPRNVPYRSCVLKGRRERDGEIHWEVSDNSQAPKMSFG
jgi:hypothetical protein